MPVTTLTAIRPDDLGSDERAAGWLAGLRGDHEALAAEVDDAVRLINRAVHAHRAAALDPQIADVGPGAALAVRVGFGDGEALADGEYSAAVEIPYAERRRRAELLRPQERVAEVLGGRAGVPACELLVIRARSDLDAGRVPRGGAAARPGARGAAGRARALEAPDQEPDFAALEQRREATAAAAAEAAGGELGAERLAGVEETLRIAERVLRRKRALG